MVEGMARSQLTRQRIIDATVAVLVARGFTNTTMRSVSAQAATSVGAVQYHFPNKQALLIETLTEIFQEVVARLSDLGRTGGQGPDRAERIVRTLWEFYSSARFLAASEILMGTRMDPGADRPVMRVRDVLTRAYQASWNLVLADSPLAPASRLALLQFIISALRGMGALAAQMRESDYFEPQLVILEGVLARVLATGKLPCSMAPTSPQDAGRLPRYLAVV